MKKKRVCFVKFTDQLLFQLDFQTVAATQEASVKSTAPNTTRGISCKSWSPPVEYPSWQYN